jgi:hypothetical protein
VRSWGRDEDSLDNAIAEKAAGALLKPVERMGARCDGYARGAGKAMTRIDEIREGNETEKWSVQERQKNVRYLLYLVDRPVLFIAKLYALLVSDCRGGEVTEQELDDMSAWLKEVLG